MEPNSPGIVRPRQSGAPLLDHSPCQLSNPLLTAFPRAVLDGFTPPTSSVKHFPPRPPMASFPPLRPPGSDFFFFLNHNILFFSGPAFYQGTSRFFYDAFSPRFDPQRLVLSTGFGPVAPFSPRYRMFAICLKDDSVLKNPLFVGVFPDGFFDSQQMLKSRNIDQLPPQTRLKIVFWRLCSVA